MGIRAGWRLAIGSAALQLAAWLACGTALAADEDPSPAPSIASVQRLVALMEVSPDTCVAADPSSDSYRTMQADVAAFRSRVPEAAEVPIDIGDCYWDGIVVQGGRIVLSTQLARATPAQRFFIVAHELGHVVRRHHDAMAALSRRLLELHGGEAAAAAAIRADAAAPLSRANEAEADDFAVRLMLRAGFDAEEAAQFWDQIDRQSASTSASHPPARLRATAIRRVAARAVAAGAGTSSGSAAH